MAILARPKIQSSMGVVLHESLIEVCKTAAIDCKLHKQVIQRFKTILNLSGVRTVSGKILAGREARAEGG